jgi:Coenzyme F390 synthetase
MNIYSLDQVVNIARTHSVIYQKLYAQLKPQASYELKHLPVLTNEQLMEFVHDEEPDFVFANGNTHGLIFESSASTGKAKVTLFGRDEWDTHTRLLASQHWKNGLLKENDRLTNLCASAYLSYRIVHSVVERFPGKISEVPLGCDYDYGYIYGVITKYHSNVLAGVNSTFLGLAYHMTSRGLVNHEVERLLGGGELMYGAQLEVIRRAFPNAEIVSFMFGTTETGALGYSEPGDALNEFSVFEGACIVELIDEVTGLPIEAPGQVGKCVATSLTRIAAPAIRIDTGDYACWVEKTPGKRKLRV